MLKLKVSDESVYVILPAVFVTENCVPPIPIVEVPDAPVAKYKLELPPVVAVLLKTSI